MAWNVSSLGKLIASFFSNPPVGADSKMLDLTHTVVGGGRSLGGATSNTQTEFLTTNANRRGIRQSIASVLWSHAVGDASARYGYNRGHWGVSAGSDEGANGITTEVLESPTWFHGTVSSTTGTGDTAPVLANTSGDAYTLDGGYLLNITKGTLSGTLTGVSTALSLTINSGSVATFLNKLPITGASLPVSTAIGIATGAIAPALTTRDVPVAVSVTVNLAQIGGVFHLFTNGSVVSVAGNQQPEQSIVSGASGLLAGNQQTITLHVCNANSQAVIFQGGIQGNFISPDNNITLGFVRGAYFAFGSLTGTDMIYGNQVEGGITGNILPNLGCEGWTATGANSAWHLYPGAEVVKNTDSGFAMQLEQNGVAWANTDVVECAPFPTGGGATAFFVREQYTPNNGSFGMSGASILMSGPATSGGNTAGIRLTNGYATPVNYFGSSGPLQAPGGLAILGQFANPIYIQTSHDASNNAILFVQNHNTHNDTTINVIELNWAGGGLLSFDATSGRWHVDKFDTSVLTVGGSPISSGITQLTGDVTAGPGSGSQVSALSSTTVTPGSYTNANLTVDAKGRLTAAASGSAGTVTTSGSPASGNLTKFSGSTAITNGDLSGDVTTSGTLTATVVKVNGATVPASQAYVGTNSSSQIVAAPSPALVQLAQQVLGAPAATITLSAIPGGYTSLIIVLVGRSASAVAEDDVWMQANGDTGNNYWREFLLAFNATVTGGTQAGVAKAVFGTVTGANASANVPGSFRGTLPYYAGTTFTKVGICQSGFRDSSQTWVVDVAWNWNSTTAITSLVLGLVSGGNFVTGTTITLYGEL